MLRMTRSATNSVETLILEGKLLRPWVEALRNEIDSISGKSMPARIDLAALSFVDAAGAQQLRELEQQGVELVGASVFIRGLLDLQR